MVKGISRQVIVMEPAGEEIFSQAIFILKDNAPQVTEEQLLQEAKRLANGQRPGKRLPLWLYGSVWAAGGALVTGVAWLLTVVLY